MPITSLLEFTVRPEQLEGAEQFIADLLVATRAFEGCTGVDVLRDAADAAHFVLVEGWESLEADDAYRAWRGTPEGASGLRDRVVEPPVLTRFESVASF
jgi:quinol monooxygenase YgiN